MISALVCPYLHYNLVQLLDIALLPRVQLFNLADQKVVLWAPGLNCSLEWVYATDNTGRKPYIWLDLTTVLV